MVTFLGSSEDMADKTKRKRGQKRERKAGTKLWRLCLSKEDYEAMQYLQDRYALFSQVATLRYSLVQQMNRDAEESHDKKYVTALEKIKESVSDLLVKARKSEIEVMRAFSFWRVASDIKYIESIQKTHKLDCAAEAVRLALRVQAELDGYVPKEGW